MMDAFATDNAKSADDAEAGGSGRMARARARAELASGRYRERAQTRPLLGLPLAFLAQYTARQGVLLASAVAFRLFLWLLPLALLAAGILAAAAADSGNSIGSASKSAGLTGAASHQVAQALRDGHRSWGIAVITGGVLFVWATRTLMRTLTVASAHAWATPVPKAGQKRILITTLMFAATWLLVFACTAALHKLGRVVPGGLLLGFLAQGLLISVAWLLISQRLPDRRQSWHELIPGSLFFGFGLALLSLVGRVYLPPRFAHSSAVYGSLGVASVMLVWLLLIGQLIISSAFINSVWCDYRRDRQAAKARRSDRNAGGVEEPAFGRSKL
ncbi:MAG: hypothetical protein JWN96_3834 [Mycobacterium sp.]|nr:hypothetical protein [Mycobacterium sp.]